MRHLGNRVRWHRHRVQRTADADARARALLPKLQAHLADGLDMPARAARSAYSLWEDGGVAT